MDKARVMVRFEGGDGELLFTFFDDELSFDASEFIGLTKEQGHALFLKRDTAYLQS